jgi:hypothetical protein
VANPLTSNDVNGKVDYVPSERHQVVGSYFFTRGSQTQSGGGNMPWSVQTYSWQQQNFNAGDTWTLSPTVINQFRMTYVRNFGGRVNTPGTDLGDLGSTFRIQDVKSLPAINVSSAMNFGQAIQGPVAGSNYYGVRDSVNIMKSKHAIKTGADASLEKFIQDTSLNNYSTWSFDGKKTNSSLADFLIGQPASFKQDTPVTKIDNDWYTGLYIQDDYRVHPRLTLNIGLRYEMPTSMTDPHDRKMAFAPGVQSTIAPKAPLGLLFPGDPGISRGIINPSRRMFAPRVGLAWDPFGDGKTSVRAGAGVFYGSISSNNMNLTTDYQPFSARQTFANVKTLADPYGNMPGGSPFPLNYDPANPRFILPADVSTLATNFHFPYTYQLNFSVQRQVRADISVTTAYVGSVSHHLPFSVDRNYAAYTPGATTANLPGRRPYLPNTLGIIYYEDGIINANYHGWQTTVDKRMSHGVTLRAYYVFSKSLEGAQSQNNQPTGGAENFNNLAIERGRTNNDRRHTFNFSTLWEINYFKGSQAFVRNVLNGWTVSAIGIMRSGTPNSITTGADTNVDGSNNDRADLIGNPYLDPNRSRADVTKAWFNTAAFTAPVVSVRADGNAGRNIIDNPGSKTVDFGIFRNFRIREGMKLEVRAELTNGFNLVNLPGPTTALNSANFGKIVGTQSNMRQSQVGMRLAW